MLREARAYYVIENVPRAPLLDPTKLCGSAFGLRVIRHRLFETNWTLMAPPCVHGWMRRDLPPAWNRVNPLRAYAVSGGWQNLDHADVCLAMGIDWDVTPKELSEAIPPAYTEFIGEQFVRMVEGGWIGTGG
jgi:DNA (cytosine-5)-methyltransferase 1